VINAHTLVCLISPGSSRAAEPEQSASPSGELCNAAFLRGVVVFSADSGPAHGSFLANLQVGGGPRPDFGSPAACFPLSSPRSPRAARDRPYPTGKRDVPVEPAGGGARENRRATIPRPFDLRGVARRLRGFYFNAWPLNRLPSAPAVHRAWTVGTTHASLRHIRIVRGEWVFANGTPCSDSFPKPNLGDLHERC